MKSGMSRSLISSSRMMDSTENWRRVLQVAALSDESKVSQQLLRTWHFLTEGTETFHVPEYFGAVHVPVRRVIGGFERRKRNEDGAGDDEE